MFAFRFLLLGCFLLACGNEGSGQTAKQKRAYDKLVFRVYIVDEVPYRWASRSVDTVDAFEKIDKILTEIEFHKDTNPGDVTVGSKDALLIEFYKQEKLIAKVEQIGTSHCWLEVSEEGFPRPKGSYLARLNEEQRRRLRIWVEGL